MAVTERTVDGFQAGPIDGYSFPAWWVVETGCPMDSVLCDKCCKATINAAWRRHDDKVRATRMRDSDIAGTIENDGACMCDFCGAERV